MDRLGGVSLSWRSPCATPQIPPGSDRFEYSRWFRLAEGERFEPPKACTLVVFKPRPPNGVPTIGDLNGGYLSGATCGQLVQRGYQGARANRLRPRQAAPRVHGSRPMAATELSKRHWGYLTISRA